MDRQRPVSVEWGDLDAIVEYNWTKELQDYFDQRFQEQMEPNANHHVFTRLARVHDLLYGDGRDAEAHFLELCEETHTCPKCGQSTEGGAGLPCTCNEEKSDGEDG